MPADKIQLEEILKISDESFAGKLTQDESQYLFVAEDAEINRVIGTSKIVAKHGTEDNPNLLYKN